MGEPPRIAMDIEVVTEDDETWAELIMDAPAGWVFEIPGRRDERGRQIELTLIKEDT